MEKISRLVNQENKIELYIFLNFLNKLFMKKIMLLFILLIIIKSSYSQKPVWFQDEKTQKIGFKDETGKITIQPKYDKAFQFEDKNYTAVNIGFNYEKDIGGKWGIMDTKGKIIIPIKYDNAQCLDYNLFALNIGHIFSNMDAMPYGKIAIFNALGKQLTPFIYSGFLTAIQFEEGFAILETNDKKNGQQYGLLDSTGKVALPANFQFINGFNEGFCLISKNNKYGFLDKKLKMIIPLQYDDARSFFEGLAAVKLNEKWGFIDKLNKEVISFQYEKVKPFHEGYAAAQLNKKWGVINKSNQVIVDFQYEDIVWIKKDANEIRIKKGNKYFEVDRQGNEMKKNK